MNSKSIIIDRIEISAFGALKEVLIEPKSGLNVIVAPNESGKSTIAAFIKFIFYGFSGIRLQTIADNEKKKYIPWDLQHAAGAIIIKTPKGRYRVERSFSLPAKENVLILDTTTGKQVFNGICPGNQFFGVGEEVFAKSTFFRQLFVPQSGDDELAEQLQNLIFSADEQTSLSKAMKRLKDARNSLTSRTNGQLPKLRKQYDELVLEFTEAEKQNSMVFIAQKQLKKVQQDIAEKQREVDIIVAERENIDKYETKLKLVNFEEQDKLIDKALNEYNTAKNNFVGGVIPDREFIQQLINDNLKLNGETQAIKEQEQYMQDNIDKYNILCDESPLAEADVESAELSDKYSGVKTRQIIFFIIAAVLGIASGIAYYFHTLIGDYAPIIVYSLMGLSGSFGILFIVSFFMWLNFGKKYGIMGIGETKNMVAEYPMLEVRIKTLNSDINDAKKRIDERKEKCNELVQSIIIRISQHMQGEFEQTNITTGIEKLDSLSADARTKLALYESKRKTQEIIHANADIEKLTEYSKDAVLPKRNVDEVDREVHFHKAALNALIAKERENEQILITHTARAKNPAELAGKRDSVAKIINDLDKKATALDTAIELLDTASNFMRSTISPKLTQYASEYFDNASCGRYRLLEVDNKLNLSYSARAYTKSADFMSAGTRDSAYLCLRLALIKVLYRDAIPPVILDDVFGRLDHDRLAAMLDILASVDSQVFIFSCVNRERDYLLGKGVELNDINLGNVKILSI
ncbi:MAG: hypothetical protein A2Y17_07930 [Clostridiales bacterium GWF2_38_85]|nr:MAG: hypothetical protein A2Y17_07930 [Clostridiales bacterium GWF2_38_85]